MNEHPTNNTSPETPPPPGESPGEEEATVILPPRPPAKKPWGRYVGVLLLIAAVFALGRYTARSGGGAGSAVKATKKATKYHCPMHPTYVSDKPGECPICGMTLVPIEEEKGGGPEVTSTVVGRAVAKISPEKQQLIGLRTGKVTRQPATKTLRTVGVVAADETLLSRVHTKFDGWIEKVYVDYEGKYVAKGKPLLTIYSPDLVATQEEYLLALTTRKTLRRSDFDNVSQGGDSLLAATRRRLELWDIPPSELRRIEKTGKPIRALTLYAPTSGYVLKRMAVEGTYVKPGTELYSLADLSRVWVLGDIYEYELPLVKVGQRAKLTTEALPGVVFHGVLDYLYPTIEQRTRTAQVRFTFSNPGLRLRPGMYVNITLEVPLGNRLLAPEEAVLDSGLRKIVFVARGNGMFEPREVGVGQKVGDKYVVLRGLSEGENIVVNGNFVVDSESQLKAAIGGMGGMAGMSHGKKKEKKGAAASGPSSRRRAPRVNRTDRRGASASGRPKRGKGRSKGASRPQGRKASTYTCPMHPEVVEDHPGKCPKCGMFLQARLKPGERAVYTCPMHPEVVQDHPGKCPKCGMFLEAIVK